MVVVDVYVFVGTAVVIVDVITAAVLLVVTV